MMMAATFSQERGEWLRAILRDPNMRSAYRIAAALGDYLNRDNGTAWPSLPTLADQVGAHVATVRRAINRLVEAGYLSRTIGRGRGHSCTYRIAVPAPSEKVAKVLPFTRDKRSQKGSRTATLTYKKVYSATRTPQAASPPTPSVVNPPEPLRPFPRAVNEQRSTGAGRAVAPRQVGLWLETPDGRQRPANGNPDRAALFTEGLATVVALTGCSNGAARTFLGRLVKESGNKPATVLRVLRDARASPPVEPKAWLMGAVKPKAQPLNWCPGVM